METIYIALENVRSLYNIGAVFRTCSFFGVYNVILVGYSGKNFNTQGKVVLHEDVKKTALGSENDLAITFLESADALIKFASKAKLSLIAVEQSEKSKELKNYKLNKNAVLVFGNEVEGVSPKILKNATHIIEISHYGKHKSLNVTTACGVVLYQLTKTQSTKHSKF